MAADTGDPADSGLGDESDEQLGPTDAEVVRHAVAGTVCDLTARLPNQRHVSLSILYELCVGGRWEAHPKGVRLIGALIDGTLDFEHAALRVPLLLASCEVHGGLLMTWAKIPRLALRTCRLAVVDLTGAAIEGQLVMSGAKLLGADAGGNSLIADRLRVGGDVHLDGLETVGAVRLLGAAIEGQLVMSGAKLLGADGDGQALVAGDLRVRRDVFLNKGFESSGVVHLADAAIGQLSMGGGKVTRSDGDGNSLVADRMRLTGSAFLEDGFETVGAVRLTGAAIESQLSMRGAKLTGSDNDGDSLVADRLRVGGDVHVDTGFEAVGAVRLAGAAIEGQLGMRGAKIPDGLILYGASCREVWVTELSSPPVGHVELRGFRFSALGGDTSWRQQLAWVRYQGFQHSWSPDPYEQLAAWYDRTGDEGAARRIRVAQGNDQLRHLSRTKPWRSLGYRLWRWPLGWLVGYGYRRWPAGLLLVVILLAAGGLFRWAEVEDGMVPNEPAVDDTGDPVPCGEAYPCFNSLVYGADVTLPIIDFGQDDAWRPVETPDQGQLFVGARWVLIAAGWVLASVFVAAFTSLVQRS